MGRMRVTVKTHPRPVVSECGELQARLGLVSRRHHLVRLRIRIRIGLGSSGFGQGPRCSPPPPAEWRVLCGCRCGMARPNLSPTPDVTSSLRSTLAARRSSCLLVFSALLGLGLGCACSLPYSARDARNSCARAPCLRRRWAWQATARLVRVGFGVGVGVGLGLGFGLGLELGFGVWVRLVRLGVGVRASLRLRVRVSHGAPFL